MFSVQINAQDTPFDKNTIPDKALLSQCQDSIKYGDKFYNKKYYKKALAAFLFAQNHNESNAALNFKIGHCYLNSPVKVEARKYLEKAYELEEKIGPDILYNLGQAFQYEHDWNNAIKYYKEYQGTTFRNKVGVHLKECEYALSIKDSLASVEIIKLGININSPYGEYVPVVTADGKKMFFTSRRPETVGGQKDYIIDAWMEDVYFSELGKDGNWSPAKNMGTVINSNNHDASVSISPDGQSLFVYRFEEGNGGDIYESDLLGDVWDTLKPLNDNINTKHQEVSVSMSSDHQTLYFVSDKPGGVGGKDIYISTKDETGDWGEAKNLGKVINTKEDEESVFIHPDGKTLYFSSAGHQTIGGFDVFRSDKVDGEWTTPKNLGMPINTADNDICFVVTADGKEGYYSSGKIGGKGEKDIYKIIFNEPEKNLFMLTGIVEDEEGKKLEAAVVVTNLTTGEVALETTSDKLSGEFIAIMENGSRYKIEATKEGFTPYIEEIDITESVGYKQEKKVVLLPNTGAQEELDQHPDLLYTIQVATRIKRRTADSIKVDLENKGIEKVFIQTIYFTDTDEELFRVRISQFDTRVEAEAYGDRIDVSQLPDGNYWVDNVRKDDFFVKKETYEVLEEE